MADSSDQKIAGLDSIRFVAAGIVVFCHIELLKHYLDLPALASKAVIYESGKLAVAAFFALSGFLITSLLLKEKKQTGTIQLRNFYMRRGLRIWPLYYLVLLLVFFALPHFQIFYLPQQTEELQQYFGLKLIFSAVLMPQMLLIKFMPVPGAEQLWTIGTEEIFYFLWPLFIRKTKNPTSLTVAGIVIFAVSKFFIYQYSGAFVSETARDCFYKLYLFLYYNRIDCLLIGALSAIFFQNPDSKYFEYLKNKWLQFFVLIIIVAMYFYGIMQNAVDYFLYSFCFAWIISAIAASKINTSFWLIKISEKMGRVSYGIYLLHFILVFLAFTITKLVFGKINPDSIFTNVILYSVAYLLTFTAAIVSYKFFEKPILKLKSKFRN